MPRFHVDLPLAPGTTVALPPGAARHVQVLRLQPGDGLTLFNGQGGEFDARITRIGRTEVEVAVGAHDPVDRELRQAVTLAVGMPANERMDTLVEKATELGVAVIQPLVCERSVLRLSGERAQRRVAHWRGVAVAASEQSGRTRVPQIGEARSLRDWLADAASQDLGDRWLLSPAASDRYDPRRGGPAAVFLSGPEGGLSEGEEQAARDAGFKAVGLGARILRADTAPLAVLAALALHSS